MRLLVRVILITARGQDVAVTRVRAVLRRRVRGRGVTALAQTAVRPRVMGPTLLSDRRAHRRRAYVLDVADALHPTVTLAAHAEAAARHRSRRKLRRWWRVAAHAAAHVLALADEAAGVRGRRRRRLLASRPETERPAQGPLQKDVDRFIGRGSCWCVDRVDLDFLRGSRTKEASKRAIGRCRSTES